MIYFNPNVWGTVSDWCMVIVTIVTAFYLYKTLKAQKEVQFTQNKLFEIERVRFIESIKPNLKYSISTEVITPESDTNSRIFTIEITNDTYSNALDISIEHQEMQNIHRVVFTRPKQNHLKNGDDPYYLHFLVEDFMRSSNYVIFTIRYKDVSGNQYQQRTVAIIDHYGNEINAGLPELMN